MTLWLPRTRRCLQIRTVRLNGTVRCDQRPCDQSGRRAWSIGYAEGNPDCREGQLSRRSAREGGHSPGVPVLRAVAWSPASAGMTVGYQSFHRLVYLDSEGVRRERLRMFLTESHEDSTKSHEGRESCSSRIDQNLAGGPIGEPAWRFAHLRGPARAYFGSAPIMSGEVTSSPGAGCPHLTPDLLREAVY